MNNSKLNDKIAGFVMTAFFISGLGFLFSTEASAQYRRDNRQTRRVERFENRNITRIAEAQGYNDGLREGANANRGRKRYNPYSQGKYKKATNGYKSNLGNKETYKRFYRQAFVRGYDEAYYGSNRGVRRNRRGW